MSTSILAALAIAAVATVVLPHVSNAATEPGAVLARMKEAEGGAAWDSLRSAHTRSKLAAAGLTGSMERWEDLRDGRLLERLQLGPLTGASGYDGSLLWSQDSSGQSHTEDEGDGRLGGLAEAFRRAHGYWYPERFPATFESLGSRADHGRHFDVVRVSPAGARPFELWIDSSSHLLDRIVEKRAIETRTTYLSDYRTVGSVRVPFHLRASNGETKYDQEETVDSVVFDEAVEASSFQVPPPPPPDFHFANGATSTRVPFELVNGHIFLDVMLGGGGPYHVICDTGGQNIVTPGVAKALGLVTQGALQGRGVGEKSEDVGLAKIHPLAVGDVTLDDQLFAVFPIDALARIEGVPIDGVIGYEVFKRFVVRVDYQNRALTLFTPGTEPPPGDGVVVPFTFNETHIEVEGKIDGLPGKFSIDTGSRASLDLLRPFAERHHLAEKLGAHLEGVTGWGVGGAARSLVGRAHTLELGGVAIDAPVAMISRNKGGAFSDSDLAGNVGAGVLSRFTITFDYGKKLVVLEKNARYGERDTYDRAGMWFNRADDGTFEIVDVPHGTPAAKAGLTAGDRILSVDGKAASELVLPELRLRLRTDAPGTAVQLRVRSHGKERDVTVVLAELV